MLRYKYIITVKDNSEYRKKERVINVLKYTFTILIGVFMIILVLIQYGQHENDEFFKKY
jgi:preprotein translocase subunit SecG